MAPGLVQTGFLDTLVDVDTQRARHQAIYDSNKQYADNLTWVKGTHAIVSGVDVRWLPTIHDRDDKVIGSLNSLVAAMDADLQFLSIPQADRPPTCAPAVPASGGNPAIPAVTTNCIRSSDTQTWDRLYAASLGLVDNVGILIVRDGNLQPKPLGRRALRRRRFTATLRGRILAFFRCSRPARSPIRCLCDGIPPARSAPSAKRREAGGEPPFRRPGGRPRAACVFH